MIKIKSEAQKKLSELRTMKQKGGFTGPGSSWSFIAKVLGLIIGIFDEILTAQENLKRDSAFGPLISEGHGQTAQATKVLKVGKSKK